MLGADRKVVRSYMGAPRMWRAFCRAVPLDVCSQTPGCWRISEPYFKRDQVRSGRLNGWSGGAARRAQQVGIPGR